uniref:Putative ATPase domain containing protein n=1 Tax=viral metagenome TaxID=1070528 RepID=A0A6M3KLG4_9ZZZZ
MECDLLFKKHGKEYLPLDGDGGGPADVADFALRIAFWSLSKNRPVFVLDEPFKFVSYDLQGKVSDMLRMICDKLNIQIIMVSHQLGINKQADKTFKVVKESGISRVIEV